MIITISGIWDMALGPMFGLRLLDKGGLMACRTSDFVGLGNWRCSGLEYTVDNTPAS
jgi:hypothetical protein